MSRPAETFVPKNGHIYLTSDEVLVTQLTAMSQIKRWDYIGLMRVKVKLVT
jgi:hypothetical protein